MRARMTIVVVFLLLCADNSKAQSEPTSHAPVVVMEGGKKYQEIYFLEPLAKRLSLQSVTYRLTMPTEEPSRENPRATHDKISNLGALFTVVDLARIKLSVGGSLYWGNHEPPGPAGNLNTEYESRWFRAEAVAIQGLRRSAAGYRDHYFYGLATSLLPCWSKSACEVGLALDRTRHQHHQETMVGTRIALPIPNIRQVRLNTKLFVKIMTHNMYIVGFEFRREKPTN